MGQFGTLPQTENCVDEPRDFTNRPPRAEMKSEQEVLSYRLPSLVERLRKELSLSEKEAGALFVDMLRFLYLCANDEKQRSFSPPHLIDEAWHTFIIFTKDYEQFCRQNFGFFVHHVPLTDEIKKLRPGVQGKATVEAARELFGELSKYWVMNGPEDCDQCAPLRDCSNK